MQAKFFPVLNFCLGSVVNNEVWFLIEVSLVLWTNEHICYEMSLPGNLHDEANLHACILVSTAEAIDYK